LANTDCQSPEQGNSSGRFEDRWSFSGAAGQSVMITVTSAAFTPYIFLVRSSDAAQVNSTFGSGTTAQIPSSGFFNLPTTDIYFIDVSSTAASATGNYSISLAGPGSTFGASGTVTNAGVGLAGVAMTFSVRSGSGSLPAAVMTDATGHWSQTGSDPATAYRVTPSESGYIFQPQFQDFGGSAANLNFAARPITCPVLAVTPITVGQTVSGALAVNDCTSPVLNTSYHAD